MSFNKGEVTMRNYFKILLLIMVLAISGCGSGATSADPMGTDTISVIAAPTSLGAGASSIITATVLHADGTAATLRSVTFSISPNNSGGTITVNDDGKNNGIATATYTAGTVASAGSIQDTVKASIENGASAVVFITRTAASTTGTYTVAVSPSPASVTAGQVSIITATVTNGSNAAVGVSVDFTLPINGSGATLSAATATTDTSGKAIVIYQPGVTSPTLSIQDTVQAAVGTAISAVAITRTGSSTSAFIIAASAAPAALTADNSNSVVTANVKNNVGTVISGVTVTFTVTGGGTVPAPGTATTDGSGNAVIIFTGGPGARPTGETDVVTASITVSGNTYTSAVVLTYP
jgi:hypothetical protein